MSPDPTIQRMNLIMFPITTITCTVLAILYLALAIKVIQFRHQYKVSIGAGAHKNLEMVIRAHGNFSEYVPISLLLLLCAEANQAMTLVLIIASAFLITGRVLHAYAFIKEKHHFKYRKRGMILTFTTIFTLALLNLILIGKTYY